MTLRKRTKDSRERQETSRSISRNFRNNFIFKHKTRSMKESTKNVPSPPTSLITTMIPRAPMNLQFKKQQMMLQEFHQNQLLIGDHSQKVQI